MSLKKSFEKMGFDRTSQIPPKHGPGFWVMNLTFQGHERSNIIAFSDRLSMTL